MAVAIFLALVLTFSHIYAGMTLVTAEESVRIIMFVVIGYIVAVLSERITKDAEKALEENMEFSSHLLDNSPNPIIVSNPDTSLRYTNPALEMLTGFSSAELTDSKAPYPWWTEETMDETRRNFEKAMRLGARRLEELFQTKNGERFWVEITSTPVIRNGKLKYYIANWVDITERKKVEEALRQSENEYRTIFETTGTATVIIEDDMKLSLVNTEFEKLSGYSKEEVEGKESWTEFVVKEERERMKENHRLRRIDPNAAPTSYEFQLIDKTGKVRDILLTVNMIPGTKKYVSSLLDITERKKIEKVLQESEERYRILFNSGNDAVFVHRVPTEGKVEKFIAANDIACQKLGYTREELLNLSHLDIIAHEKLEDVPSIRKKLLQEEHILFETVAVTKDGRELPFEISGHMFNLDEKPTMLSIARDVTERKRANEERERLLKELEVKNAEMERFIYTVSHDLRAPLLTIQGFASILRDNLEQNETEKVEKNLKNIENGAVKMEKLLEDTLQLSRIGHVANPPEDVPFGEFVRDAQEQTAEQIKSSGVEISVADDFPTVHVDRMRIAEVLVNLITNSIKFMGEQPHPKIEIGYRVDGEETVFFVKDNGIGIDKSQHEKVFELFYMLDRRIRGTGAGFAIVKRIIEVHGGRIWIESEKGKGCTVCFTLPLTHVS